MYTEEKSILLRIEGIVIDSIKSFVLIPILVYYIGFLYTQGLCSPMTTYTPFELFKSDIIQLSNYTVMENGIKEIINLALIIIFSLAICIFLEPIFEKKIFVLYEKKLLRVSACLIGIMGVLFLLFIYAFISDYIFRLIGEVCIVTLFMALSTTNKRLRSISKSKEKNNSDIDIKVSELITLISYLIMFYIASTLFFWNGLAMQNEKIDGYISGNEMYSCSIVYFAGDTSRTYLDIDLSNEAYIGYDLKQKKTTIIPINQISRIENFKMRNVDFQLCSEDEFEKLNSEQKSTINRVKEYYKYRTNQEGFNSNKVAELLSDDCFKKVFGKISVAKLQSLWEINGKYNNMELADLVGVDFSVPARKDKTTYSLAASEIWKDYRIITVFTLSKIKGQWMIVEIENKVTVSQYD